MRLCSSKGKIVVYVLFLFISVLLLYTIVPIKAYATITSLPSGVVIGDDKGLFATSEGEYYIDIPKVTSGQTYEKEITIRSLDVKEPFDLGLLVKKITSKGSLDFNQHMTMILTLDGKEIYKGPVLGDGSKNWALEPLSLGICKYGTDQILIARFEMDGKVSNEDFKEESEMLFQWTFVATKNQSHTTGSTGRSESTESSQKETAISSASKSSIPPLIDRFLPKTGEDIEKALLKTVAGIWIVIITIIIWKRRKESREES
ncbi:cell wall protein [Candidatus Enterococcus ferrettii]|uniref:Uncharacterized protein n=1 Tax=Candidatus Enterococcus ferrettii TaxID=2815324 RepID=A0ABV0EZK0_9ENTE|nr:cell wall protein [Enterococcus sp. 665A]MBO1342881.1 cell wall protein [Enterococcus sp. 665A]